MADGKVRILVEGKDAGGKRTLDSIKKELAEIRGAAQSVTKTFNTIATLGGLTIVGRQVADLARAFGDLTVRGTQVLNVQRAFAVATGDQTGAMQKLEQATEGLVSRYDLMVGLNRAMTLGAAENVDQFAELSQTAIALGRALGVDAAFAMESLSLGIGRQSKLILDNLGLIVSIERANESYARQLGKSTGALTENEQRIAFRNAALTAAREKVAALGGAERTAGDAVKSLSAQLQNLRDEMGKLLAQSQRVQGFFQGLADAVAGAVTALAEGDQADLRQAFAYIGDIAGNAFSVAFLGAVQAALPDFLEFRLGAAIEKHLENIRTASSGLGIMGRELRVQAAIRDQRQRQRAAGSTLTGLVGLPGVANPFKQVPPPGATPVDQADLVKQLAGGGALGVLSTAELRQALDLHRQLTAQLAAGNLPLEKRVELAKQLEQLGGIGAVGAMLAGDFMRPQAAAGSDGLGLRGLDGKPQPVAEGPAGTAAAGGPSFLQEMGMALREATDLAGDFGQVMADLTTRVITGFGDAVADAFEAFVTGSQSAGEAFKTAMLGALAAVARGMGDYFTAKAIGALAEGFLGNPAAFKAAGLFTAAATAMYALSGTLGGVAKGGGGGGAAAGANATADALREAERKTGTIVVQGGLLDMSDPRQAQAMAEAIESLTGRRIIVQGA